MKTNENQSMWRPSTKLGWWAIRLAVIFIVLFLLNGMFMSFRSNATWQQVVLPFYGIFMVLWGLATGVVGLIAIIRQHERSLPVWLTLLPLFFMLFLLLGEFLGPAH